MPIFYSVLWKISSQKAILIDQYKRSEAMAIRVASKGDERLKNQKIRPKKRLKR